MKEPSVQYPTCVFGFLQGQPRLETMDYFGEKEIFLPHRLFGRVLIGVSPIILERSSYAISGIQKKSHFGFLWMKPFCLHAWVMLQLPKKCPHGGWVPGSEFGKYFRFGLWRWDVAGTLDKVTGRLKHWIGPLTIYINFSFHFD